MRSLPSSERDLAIAASNSWAVVLDNVSSLAPWLSDALSRLATGGGLSTRELYSDDEEVLFDARRPIILNGITDVATRPDLLDRAVIVEMASIPESERRREDELIEAFEGERPAILGALFTAVSKALSNVASVNLESAPRMADFAAWATATEDALGLEEGAFMGAYSANRAAATETALEADPVAEAVLSLMADREEWSGTTSALWTALGDEVEEEVRKSKAWPGAPQPLTSHMRRLVPELREVGIFYGEKIDGSRTKTLTKNKSESSRQSRQPRQEEEQEGDTMGDESTDGTDATTDATDGGEKPRQEANSDHGGNTDATDAENRGHSKWSGRL